MNRHLYSSARLPSRGQVRSIIGNSVGAFADGATLFPLLVLVALHNGYSMSLLLLTAGLLYAVSGFIFRIPMSVQPLKSIAILGVALGASQLEMRWSAAWVGGLCLLAAAFNAGRLSTQVPKALVHGLQLGLGVLLFLQGFRILSQTVGFTFPILTIATTAVMIMTSVVFRFPLLGLVATAGFLWAVGSDNATAPPSVSHASGLRPGVIAALTLPQIVLTLANSVIGTTDVARRYFGERSNAVTPQRLLKSIGIGNILLAAVGGLPFCHGSGGVTAHVRGGATHWVSNLIIGGVLIGLSIASFLGSSFSLKYPPMLLSSLLMATGIFHAMLAYPTWQISGERVRLVLMGCTALITQNLLLVLAVGAIPEALRALVKRGRRVLS